MPLTPGVRVGSFEILSRLGAGGMGEVFRARDTRLGRDVALKALPDLFAADPERVARFQREAQILAALNHPHIAAIYGLEHAEGCQFLVLELVDGQTLDQRLAASGAPARGLPIADAIAIARQVAGALQAAHDKGIVHRDLKPSNIALTHDGEIKILDFGLARLEGNGSDLPTTLSDPNAATIPPLAGLSKSPTLSPAAMTAAGMILGTAPYMSPEQAKGRAADKRSDVWAFGCVLYEMLAGKRAFDGEDVSDTLANVLKAEPDWTSLPAGLPVAVRTLLHRCLEKDRRNRVADLAVACFVLDDPAVLSPPARISTSPADARRQRWTRGAAAIAGLVAGAAVAGPAFWYATRQQTAALSRLAMSTSGAAAFVTAGYDRDIAISPDGHRVAYVGGNGTIYVRALDQLEPTPLTGLGMPRGLFFSPDGQWIGFFDTATALKKVAVTGGAPITVCRLASPPRGASWGPDDVIIFATNDPASGLLRVPAGGGDPTVVTTPNHQNGEADHLWPEFLPDSRTVLFTIVPANAPLENARVAAFDLQRGTQRVLIEHGTDAHYLRSGHLVYAQAGGVRAVAFDARRLAVRSAPIVVLPEVLTTRFGAGVFDVARNGTLVYLPRTMPAMRSLVWVDRHGIEQTIPLAPRGYQYPRLSPDEQRVAVEFDGDIWVWDIGRGTTTRLTFDPAQDTFPVWTPDGRRIVFGSERTSNGQANLFVQSADGSGAVERLTDSPNQQFPMSIAPDGSRLVFRESAPGLDLMMLAWTDPAHRPQPLLHTAAAEQNGELSPDGRWLAYQSNASGRFEIYVKPFPNVDAGQWQISTDGGIQPAWSKKGDELFYLAPGGAMMAVAVDKGANWKADTPVRLFDDRYYHGAGAGVGRTYDVSSSGRFLMVKQSGDPGDGAALIVVQNWVTELARLVRPQ